MSALSEKVRVALFGKLNVSGVTMLAKGGVHYKVAPQQTQFPFVVFDRFPADVHYALGNNLVGERDQWLVKAYVDEESSQDKEPPELAEDILAACETAIGTSLTLTGAATSRVRRVREMPNVMEFVSDRQVWDHGFFLEVFAN